MRQQLKTNRLALQQYHDTHGHSPLGVHFGIYQRWHRHGTWLGLGGSTARSPGTKCAARASLRFALPIEDSTQRNLRTKQLSVYLLSSDPTPANMGRHERPWRNRASQMRFVTWRGQLRRRVWNERTGIVARGCSAQQSRAFSETSRRHLQTIAVGERSHLLVRQPGLGRLPSRPGARPWRQ